jgi:putative ABC transport system ATP-binding protein
MIQLKNVNKVYKGVAGDVHALKNASVNIQKGESVFIIGKSGSGKSTLLNIISGIDRCESGEVYINNTALHQLTESELSKWRGKNIGVVFQSYQLMPTLTALDNVIFPMDLVNVIPKKERKNRAANLLSDVGLADKVQKYPNELSGGEIQRVAIARALANDPPIILADEPTGNLDTKTSEQVYALFDSLIQMGKNLVIVTHENIEGKKFSQVITIKDGQILNPLQ